MTVDVAIVETWLRGWLAKRAPGLSLAADQNYFDAGAVDSFDAIALIEEAEAEFGIRFRQSDFQDRRFGTIRGFGAIVSERRQGGG
jgi:D-alanine--poly(phosphoribitol) ligase subunit 2